MPSEKTPPALSVVMATRNRPEMLRTALASVAAQTLADMEVLVLDDGSDQTTLDACAAWWPELDQRFHFFPPAAPGAPGSGPARARNRGMELARGRHVAFLDDDDRWVDPNYVQQAVRVLDEFDADLFFVNMRGENAGKITIPDWFPDSPWLTAGPRLATDPDVYLVRREDLARTMHHHYPHPNGCVFRRTLLKEVGGFWEDVCVAEDYDLILRFADRARKILYRSSPAVGFNVTPRSSVFSRTPAIERSRQCVLVSKHVRAHCTSRAIRRCARASESWHLRSIADELWVLGRRSESLAAAWKAWRVHPTLGTTRACVLRLIGRGP